MEFKSFREIGMPWAPARVVAGLGDVRVARVDTVIVAEDLVIMTDSIELLLTSAFFPHARR